MIDKYIKDDGISGTKEPELRELGGLLSKVSFGDIIICSELSRLGRKLFMVINILEYCLNRGVKLYTVKLHTIKLCSCKQETLPLSGRFFIFGHSPSLLVRAPRAHMSTCQSLRLLLATRKRVLRVINA